MGELVNVILRIPILSGDEGSQCSQMRFFVAYAPQNDRVFSVILRGRISVFFNYDYSRNYIGHNHKVEKWKNS